eukprot:Skav216801  [mRNA]  locus=scaffold2110:54093:63664:- [translate_table: standard]
MIELCLRFGHCDTALACRSQEETCAGCCLGWPVEKGTWMEDWDAAIEDAVKAAEQAAEQPFVHGLLELSRCGAELPFMSSQEMARLLDIAVLTGNKETCTMLRDATEAAVRVSRNCEVWPLRRWIGEDLIESVAEDFAKYSKVLIAALQAGADLESVQVTLYDWVTWKEIPLRVALFLKLEINQWQQLEEFFPPSQQKWRPQSNDNNLAGHFFCQAGSSSKLCVNKIQSADKVAVDVSCVGAQVVWCEHYDWPIFKFHITLLGAAILLGQPDCAIACVRQGIEVTNVALVEDTCCAEIKAYLDGEMDEHEYFAFSAVSGGHQVHFAAAADCKSAACAAGRAAVRRDGAEKQVAIHQMLRKMFRGKPFPTELVQSIGAFSIRVPKFVDELGLSDVVEGWLMPVSSSVPKFGTDASMATDESQSKNAPQEFQDVRDTAQEAGSPSGDATAEQKSSNELFRAMQASRDQVPALNIDGVCVFRLTRQATSSHLSDLLLDATGPLAALHARVLDAGCEVNPELRAEPRGSHLGAAVGPGDHRNRLEEPLGTSLRWKNRPKLKKVGPEVAAPAAAEEEDAEEDEAWQNCSVATGANCWVVCFVGRLVGVANCA